MRSLEINWLRRFDRTLVVPQVVYCAKPINPVTGQENGGYYSHPGKYELCIDGKFHDGHFGLLVVRADELAHSAIAHEWRHHWQLHNGKTFDDKPFAYPSKPYEQAIADYFRNSKTELDALLFETTVAPNWCNEYWLDLVKGGA